MRRSQHFLLIAALATGGLLMIEAVGLAQTGTSTGAFGSRSVGGASGLSGGQRSFSGGGMGRGAGGGGQTLGQGQQLGGGQAVLNRTLQSQTGGGITGNARFLRDSRGNQFVGSDTADVGTTLRTLGGQNQLGLGAQGQRQNLLGQNNNRQGRRQVNQSRGPSPQTPFRVTRTAGFVAQPVTGPGALNVRLAKLVQNSTRIQTRSLVEVQMQGRTAVLRGTVATDYDRDLAAQLVLLAPGVVQVDNQLEVAEEPAQFPPE